MSAKLPPSASVASQTEGAKLHAPAAARNADVICDLLAAYAPEVGPALELASGTGQHVVAFARRLPGLTWQPSEVDPKRIASINAYVLEAGVDNVSAALLLDATRPGWRGDHCGQGLIVLVNLLHLIGTEDARSLIAEAMAALRPGGRFVIYGPFMRAGGLVSAGDARFHAQLTQADPSIGYKNDETVQGWLQQAGASSVERVEMPANNLAFIATC